MGSMVATLVFTKVGGSLETSCCFQVDECARNVCVYYIQGLFRCLNPTQAAKQNPLNDTFDLALLCRSRRIPGPQETSLALSSIDYS